MWGRKDVVGALILLSTWVVLWLIFAPPAQPSPVELKLGCWYWWVDNAPVMAGGSQLCDEQQHYYEDEDAWKKPSGLADRA